MNLSRYIVYINPSAIPEIVTEDLYAIGDIILSAKFLHLYIKLKHVDTTTHSKLIQDYMSLPHYG